MLAVSRRAGRIPILKPHGQGFRMGYTPNMIRVRASAFNESRSVSAPGRD